MPSLGNPNPQRRSSRRATKNSRDLTVSQPGRIDRHRPIPTVTARCTPTLGFPPPRRQGSSRIGPRTQHARALIQRILSGRTPNLGNAASPSKTARRFHMLQGRSGAGVPRRGRAEEGDRRLLRRPGLRHQDMLNVQLEDTEMDPPTIWKADRSHRSRWPLGITSRGQMKPGRRLESRP